MSNTQSTGKVLGSTMSNAEFEAQVTTLCKEYGLEEFALQGRHAERAPNGHYPHKLYIWNQGEQTVAEEAGYYFTRLPDNLKLEEMKRDLRKRKGEDSPVDPDASKPSSFNVGS